MALMRDESSMACRGAPTLAIEDMQECVACGTSVAWDLTEHPLFGFQGCMHAKPEPLLPHAKEDAKV